MSALDCNCCLASPWINLCLRETYKHTNTQTHFGRLSPKMKVHIKPRKSAECTWGQCRYECSLGYLSLHVFQHIIAFWYIQSSTWLATYCGLRHSWHKPLGKQAFLCLMSMITIVAKTHLRKHIMAKTTPRWTPSIITSGSNPMPMTDEYHGGLQASSQVRAILWLLSINSSASELISHAASR